MCLFFAAPFAGVRSGQKEPERQALNGTFFVGSEPPSNGFPPDSESRDSDGSRFKSISSSGLGSHDRETACLRVPGRVWPSRGDGPLPAHTNARAHQLRKALSLQTARSPARPCCRFRRPQAPTTSAPPCQPTPRAGPRLAAQSASSGERARRPPTHPAGPLSPHPSCAPARRRPAAHSTGQGKLRPAARPGQGAAARSRGKSFGPCCCARRRALCCRGEPPGPD
jgi:hypothetical protein